MGCCSSSSAGGGQKGSEGKVQTQRRRLSVGHVENTGDVAQGDGAEDDRGLLVELNKDSVLDMLADLSTGDRKFSVGSATDMAKTSFANKSIQALGDEFEAANYGLGYTCRKGLKPESPNQDSWSVLKVDGNFSIYGVYDGHGKDGHDVSNFVKENMPKLLIKDNRFQAGSTEQERANMCMDNFKKMQNLVTTSDRMKKLNAQMAGTTATVCIHNTTEKRLTIAHVADSTCVMGSYTDSSKKQLVGVPLTRDHKPDLKDEHSRIVKAGGRVVFDGYANHRVYAKNGRYPGLNMSRCLGDLLGHSDAGCSCEPEVTERIIDEKDHVLLLCSDGVWEFITPQEAVNLVGGYGAQKAMLAAERLAKEAWDRWIAEEGGAVVDDITVLLVYLNLQDSDKK